MVLGIAGSSSFGGLGGGGVQRVLGDLSFGSVVDGGISVSVRTTGGQRLSRFIAASGDYELIAYLTARSMRRRMLPAIKAGAPNRSGRMMRSLDIVQRRSTVRIIGVFYSRLVRWNNGRTSIHDVIDSIYERERRNIARDVSAGIKARAGG